MPKTLVSTLLAGILGITLLLPSMAQAEFYSFESETISSWETPEEIFLRVAQTSIDLLKWTLIARPRPIPAEKYDRLKHFGTWIDDSRTEDCYDTRALCLMRDSVQQVKFYGNNPCKVYSGGWNEPYGGITYKMSTEIEVDHVVALKNAYDSGAWTWDFQQRCLYGNFMGFENHLISAGRSENRAKGDRGPDRWMPSDENYSCQHLQNWLAVKYMWNLNMTPAEAKAIENEIQKHQCASSDFQFSKAELARIQRYAEANLDLCPGN